MLQGHTAARPPGPAHPRAAAPMLFISKICFWNKPHQHFYFQVQTKFFSFSPQPSLRTGEANPLALTHGSGPSRTRAERQPGGPSPGRTALPPPALQVPKPATRGDRHGARLSDSDCAGPASAESADMGWRCPPPQERAVSPSFPTAPGRGGGRAAGSSPKLHVGGRAGTVQSRDLWGQGTGLGRRGTCRETQV